MPGPRGYLEWVRWRQQWAPLVWAGPRGQCERLGWRDQLHRAR
jgi:hypothetical protein